MSLERPAKGSLGYEMYATGDYGEPISKNDSRERKYTMIRHGIINASMLGAAAAVYYGCWQADYGPCALSPWKKGELTGDHVMFTLMMGTILAPIPTVAIGLLTNGISSAVCSGLESVISLFDKKKEDKK